MKRILLMMILGFGTLAVLAQSNRVSIRRSDDGMRLIVDGKPMMINGMNWDYFPVGTNYSYSLWNQSDDVVKAALDAEMSLLKNMGVNAVRMYTGVQPKWITYIYETYGIYTLLNHSFGRYGLNINGAWVAVTDYRDPATQELLMGEVTKLVEDYRSTPGLLLFLLGNENNYGLFWAGAETEDFPDDEKRIAFIGESRGRPMYRLMNDAALKMKSIDPTHPVAICNGDLLFSEIVAQECKDVDIYGVNMYRGYSFTDAFDRVKNELNMPIMFTEFGADAYNAKENAEDQASQAYYNLGNWREIYENAAGMGKAGNSIGGFTFQFSDGWWKYGQTKNLDVHDNNASWANGGYQADFQEGENNMNEEWFGICAKGQTNSRGLYNLYPRASYYALKEAHSYDVFSSEAGLMTLNQHFDDIEIANAVMRARGDKASLLGERGGKIRVSEIRAEFSTFATGGSLLTTPDAADPNNQTFPNRLGFDRMESYFVGIEARPEANVRANVSFNILGNVAENPINEIFYENRGRATTFVTQNGNTVTTNPNRIQVYQASYSWDSKLFRLEGFYRTGHYHWGYEGDFFGLYPEANYGPNIDIYNGFAPNGFEVEGKKQLSGLKVAFGPELWWGANAAVLVKYSKEFHGLNLTGIFHEDLDEPGAAVSSLAVPQPKTRRATIYAQKEVGPLDVEVGGIWGGQPLVGRNFQVVRGNESGYDVLEDEIKNSDTWGSKVKLTYEGGRFNWYGQASSRGLVANAGGDYTQTFTGWRLKDFGSGNVNNIFTGFSYTVGKFQIAPNFMYQQPLVDPIPQFALEDTSPARLRNILDDPFVVRSNRETQAAELLITFDPTPGSWMYQWDNDRAEDAKFAASLGFVYWHLPTSQDAAVIFPGDGRVPSAAAGAAPAQDLWEVNARIVSKLSPELGIVANIYGGTGQANGDNPRKVERYGGTLRAIYKKVKFNSHLKFNDWGPFDYHRDFNLTYPLQVMADLSTSISKPDWFAMPSTQIGLQFTYRTLNEFSPRYLPNETDDFSNDPIISPFGFPNGREWEIRTYVHINIGR
ncbi:MAG: glycoside hydrolase family 2 TIM barrel-domain containing protein [Bacteroidota bacterium]